MAGSQAYDRGEQEGIEGVKPFDNPYKRNSADYYAWMRGWTKGIAKARREANRLVNGSPFETEGMRNGEDSRVRRKGWKW
jgi:hypothetical protein